MPNRAVRKTSVVDLLSKVPVNKGSLLTSIENLLKTIESSENAVMIPTLLRDKCEFDAWELLFVAKILKASILGHVDLVEFYMNHIGLNSSQFAASQTSNTTTPTTTTNGINTNSVNITSNGTTPTNNDPNNQQSLSPSTNGHSRPLSSSPNLSPTKTATANSIAVQAHHQLQQANPTQANSSASSIVSSSTATSALSSGSSNQQASSSTSGSPTKSQSSVSWTTANQHNQSGSTSSGASIGSSFDGSQTETTVGSLYNGNPSQHNHELPPPPPPPPNTLNQDQTSAGSLLAPVVSPFIVRGQFGASGGRQAQPPSLLQLTTTNNHINSVAGTNHTIEQLTNQLSTMQTNGCLATKPPPLQPQPPTSLDGLTLSISTAAANQQSSPSGGSPSSQTISNGQANGGLAAAVAAVNSIAGIQLPHPPHAELRSSRSAGCLFRMNSGASSPRTPTTPYPQAETLANGQANGLPGDPSAPVKLLLQIEQLKLSISHVTSLLESVVELYKKSIDNIAMA